jgi:hypothetical protein
LRGEKATLVNILGSVPLLPADPVAHDLFFAALDQEFSGCQAISMASVPTDSFLWDYVRKSKFLKGKFLSHVMHGERRCHVIPVPATVEADLANFSAKRRYNMKRRIRILRHHFAGRFELQCFDSTHRIRDLVDLIAPTREFAGMTRWGNSGAVTIDRHEAESLAARGLLLIYLLIGDGRPFAALWV